MKELEVTAKHSVVRWEKSDRIPRMVQLSVVALDQVEGCNRRTYAKQVGSAELANRWFDGLREANALEESWHKEAAVE